MKEFNQYKLEILGISEMRWNDSGEHMAAGGETIIFSGKPSGEAHESVVGMILSKTAKLCLLNWKPISDRLITARFRTHARNLTIVQCYAPTEQAPLETKEDFYDQLSSTITNTPKGDILLLMGDLNAKVGSDNRGLEHIMGRCGMGTRNINGGLLQDLCLQHNLLIGGTLFPHKDIHKVTWMSPDHRTNNQIDHLLISKTWRRSLLDVRNRRGADIGSDHHLLLATLQIKLAKIATAAAPATRKKFQLDRLKTPATLQHYKGKYREVTSNLIKDRTEEWEIVSNQITSMTKEVLGTKSAKRKEWLGEETWELIERRKAIKQEINHANLDTDIAALTRLYNDINRNIKRSAIRDRRRWINSLAEAAQTAAESHNSRELYRITKRLSARSFNINVPVRSKEGDLLNTREDQLSRWREYFEQLLNNTAQTDNTQDVTECDEGIVNDPEEALNINCEVPGKSEIRTAVRELKNNKAAGPDDIPAEILKADVEATVELLYPLLKHAWDNNSFNPSWKEGLIVKIPKKGNLMECAIGAV
ncbi:uncharacterized protein LOC105203684 [Solenopsis invicta]|uniref:uncharacterized protein LOC105203684 n=1 Tax=Solenopsis invicta TaxID=13686 RepID=UPI00193D78FF|nr:uncharacterized protein LOC105203684 [Solenopsis invicta]